MSAETLIRYRAKIHEVDPEIRLPTLHPTRERAIKAAVDFILSDGIIEIEEVPVRKRQRTEYEEVE